VTVETGDNESDLQERVIKVEEVGVEERGGYDILVVEDSAGNQYTTFNDNFMQEIPDKKQRYESSVWEILFTVTDEGYINFHGFTESSEEDPVEEEIDPAEFNENYGEKKDERDNQITRQSAVHDATRIVGSMIASEDNYITGKEGPATKAEVKEEIKSWTEYFKTHHRTGEWPQ